MGITNPTEDIVLDEIHEMLGRSSTNRDAYKDEILRNYLFSLFNRDRPITFIRSWSRIVHGFMDVRNNQSRIPNQAVHVPISARKIS